MFISIPVSKIEQLTEELNPGTILAISANDKLQLAVSSEGVEEIPESLPFDTDDYMVISRRSSERNVEYYMLVPQRHFWREFRYVSNLFWVSLILTLIVGVF